ncbi:hypothetical protein scyTo_0020379, partial [Scyliorhinus torazame]|nr:hypothetical protein [Scyliorhinus torazame]
LRLTLSESDSDPAEMKVALVKMLCRFDESPGAGFDGVASRVDIKEKAAEGCRKRAADGLCYRSERRD